MAIDDLFQAGTDKVLDDRVARPLQAPTERPSFAANLWGVTSAAPKGVGAGANESAGFFADILGAYGEMQAGYARQLDPALMLDKKAAGAARADGAGARARVDSGEAFSTEMGTQFRAAASRFAPDPQSAGQAEQLLFGLARFATKAVGYSLAAGPVPGAVLTGADEGMTEADRLKAQGVDIQTRTEVGALAGVVAGVSVALPVAGKTLAQTAGLVAAGGPGGFIAQQAATKAILENAGYDKLADQYDPFDPVGLAVSTLVPAGFGAYAMRGAKAMPKAPANPAAARELSRMGGNERLALKYDDPRLDAYAVTAAQREGIPPEALLAIKNAGERSGSTAVSPKGAKGVMQFMDDTWAAYGKGDPRDPTASIDAGARFMKDLIKQYDGDVRAAIAHYNGGGKAGKAVREGRAAPAKETRDYLERTEAFIAERTGTEAGRAAASDPEMVAAARVQLVRDAIESSNPHDPADAAGAEQHMAAVLRAGDQLAAGERVDAADTVALNEPAQVKLLEELAVRVVEPEAPGSVPDQHSSAKFDNVMGAQEYINANGLRQTHTVQRTGPGEYAPRARTVTPDRGAPKESRLAEQLRVAQENTAARAAAKAVAETKTVKNKVGDLFVDTRGSDNRFHGTSREIAALSDEYAMAGDNRNIYGQGFYTTDAADISHGYMKKGNSGEPTLYTVKEKEAPKLFDMEAPLTAKIKEMAKKVFGDLYREVDNDGNSIKTLRQLYDEARAESQYEGYSRDEVQEMFDSLRFNLEQEGYNGFSHIGGAATGSNAHSVNIYWSPEKHIDITKSDIGQYMPAKAEPAAPAALAAPKAPPAASEPATGAPNGKADANPMAASLEAQSAEIAALSPDMLVQLEGMDAPMRLADALEAVKTEAARDVQDAPLLQVAAECFLRSA